MEMTSAKMKTLLVAGLPAVIGGYLGQLVVPFGLLVAASLLDYISGLAAAPARGQARNSRTGLQGICKKMVLWLLVAVGMLLDALLWYLAGTAGLQLPWGESFPVAAMVCVWLLANELMSVIENLADAGVNAPFLLPLVRWVRCGVQKAAAVPEQNDETAGGEVPGEKAGDEEAPGSTGTPQDKEE